MIDQTNSLFVSSFITSTSQGLMCIYKVPTANRGDAFMGVARKVLRGRAEDASLLWIDTKLFLPLWRWKTMLGGETNMAEALEYKLANDYKLPQRNADYTRHFKNIQNPVEIPTFGLVVVLERVPLRERHWLVFQRTVGQETREILGVSIVDGTTRMYWILAARPNFFPLEISTWEQANCLFRLCGIPGHPPQLLATLFPGFR